MNDNEIIKGYCKRKLCPPAQEIINRQQAEIERYKGVIKRLENDVLTAKAEAVKEFAEMLKKKVNLDLCEAINCSDYLYDLPKLIDNLVKEMTEQSTGYGSSKTEGNG